MLLKKIIPDSSISFYSRLLGRRRDWQAIQPSQDQECHPEAIPTLQKALSLASLELPVGLWVEKELQQNLVSFPPVLQHLLKLNIADETKHDLVLNRLSNVFPVPDDRKEEAIKFTIEADRLANIYSPIVVAGVLEVSIFFVILPMFRFLGGAGFRTISADISNDEQVHVAANIQLAIDLGYNRGKALNDFRASIIDWLVADLPLNSPHKFLASDYWQQASDNLYRSGKSSQFDATKRAIMPAFFETSSSNLPVYN